MADPGRGGLGPAHGGSGRHDREHRAALCAAGAGLLQRGPAVGGHRLRAGLRQPAAARRAAIRPVRPEDDGRGWGGPGCPRPPGAGGGAATSFGMLVAARACQGAFGALLAPSALSLLTVTFSGSKDRGKAFGVFGAIAGAGGAVGLLLGGVLTEYLSWRWCLYVNLFFAAIAVTGGAILLDRHPRSGHPRLDIP